MSAKRCAECEARRATMPEWMKPLCDDDAPCVHYLEPIKVRPVQWREAAQEPDDPYTHRDKTWPWGGVGEYFIG